MRHGRWIGIGAATGAALVAAGAFAAGGGSTGTTENARTPKGGERAAIVAAARATVPRADRGKFRVVGVRVSSLSPNWATATITPTARYRTSLEGAYTIMVRSAASNRWIVLDLGTSMVGCRIAPIRVLRDLGRGDECPPGERL